MTIFAKKHKLVPGQLPVSLKKFGSHSLAYHSLQPGLKHFITADGYIAYANLGKHPIVLGDPIVEHVKLRKTLDKFLSAHSNPTFIQISEETANVLHRYNFYINRFGVETELSLPYTLSGKKRKEIRLLFNSGKKERLKTFEFFERNTINDSFSDLIAGRKHHKREFSKDEQFSFLARSFANNEEEGVRLFGTFKDNRLVGFSLFDPMYENSRIIGYAEVISRRVTDAPKGTRVFTLLEAIKQFEKEGIKKVNLGLMPYADLNSPNRFKSSPMTQKLFSFSYKTSPLFYNFKGLSFHKSRYNGIQRPVYFASRNKLPILELLKIYKLTTGRWLPKIS